MTDHANELRRYARKIAHPAGDVPSVMLAAADEIERLAARLEAAESEALEQARLNGMGAEREAALLAKLEAAEKERDAARKCADMLALALNTSNHECANLRAKITEMEKQEPVGWIYTVNGGWDCYSPMKPTKDAYDTGSLMPRYALPGARSQPAPSVPMDVIADYLVSISAHLASRDDAKAQAEIRELLKMIASAPKPGASVPEDVMRDAERYRYLRARDDGTAGVGCWIEADGRVCDRGWLYGVQLDSAIDSFIEVLAAAPKPEAKP